MQPYALAVSGTCGLGQSGPRRRLIFRRERGGWRVTGVPHCRWLRDHHFRGCRGTCGTVARRCGSAAQSVATCTAQSVATRIAWSSRRVANIDFAIPCGLAVIHAEPTGHADARRDPATASQRRLRRRCVHAQRLSVDAVHELDVPGVILPARYDPAEVLDVLKASFENITTARNDCGRADNVNARSLYHGVTRLEPCEGEFSDGWNVIGERGEQTVRSDLFEMTQRSGQNTPA